MIPYSFQTSFSETNRTTYPVAIPVRHDRSDRQSAAFPRIAQIQRLRQDLGLNLVGAAIVLDMAQEIAQLRA